MNAQEALEQAAMDENEAMMKLLLDLEKVKVEDVRTELLHLDQHCYWGKADLLKKNPGFVGYSYAPFLIPHH